MSAKTRLIITYLPLIIGFVTAETIVYLGGDNMANYIGLIIALITVAGSILANFFQYRKDSNKIGEVKSDTSEIKPKVAIISDYTKETNDVITKNMKQNIELLLDKTNEIKDGEFKEKLNLIADEIKHKKWLQDKYNSVDKDMITAGIDSIYKENAVLKNRNNEIENENRELKAVIQIKESMITQLEKDNKLLEQRIAELSPSRDRDLEL